MQKHFMSRVHRSAQMYLRGSGVPPLLSTMGGARMCHLESYKAAAASTGKYNLRKRFETVRGGRLADYLNRGIQPRSEDGASGCRKGGDRPAYKGRIRRICTKVNVSLGPSLLFPDLKLIVDIALLPFLHAQKLHPPCLQSHPQTDHHSPNNSKHNDRGTLPLH